MRTNTTQLVRSGFILIVVLGAIMTLSILLFGFHHTVYARQNAVNSFRDGEQTLNCARAGLNVAVAAVRTSGELCREARFAKLISGQQAVPVAEGKCSITVVEEDGFLNVNSLKHGTGELDRTRVDQLLRLIDLLNRQTNDAPRTGYGIVPAIIDWTDRDSDVTYLAFVKHENTGAEEDYYRSLDPPARCRNGPVDVIDELLIVKGMTPQTLGRLRESLTTFGDGKVNINAAPSLVLQSLCESISPAVAQMILKRRAAKPFGSIAELRDVPGVTDNIYLAIKDTITTGREDRYYRVRSRGTVGERSMTIEAVLRRNTPAGNVDIIQYREL